MNSRPTRLLAFVLAAIAPFVVGCAEEQAEGMEAAYPVGASVPQAPPQALPPARVPNYAPAQPAPAAEPLQASPEVVVGDEPEAPESPTGDYADSDPSALTDFRGALDPYGTWIDDTTYGTVWVPSAAVVGDDFVPYQTAGHWAYDDDYVWVSDYGWGWAPFHYGRWAYVGGIGWEWIPGRRYAGAWVSWRYGWGDWGYVGWAPLTPTWCWHRAVAVGIGFVPVAPYAFVATGDLFASHLGTRVVGGERAGLIAAHTRPWVPASPAVGGHVIARPAVGGPPPSVMRIPATAVVSAGSNQGLMQARAFARPSATVTSGAARATAVAMPSTGSAVSAAASYPRVARAVAPAYGPPAPSHFGGRMGAGFSGNGVTAAWGPTRASSAPPMARSPSFSNAPVAEGPRPVYSSPQAHFAAPSYHATANVRSLPSAPSVHAFSGATSTGGFHGGGGYSGGSHGSGFSGGGSHGGGGGSHGGGHR